MREFFNVFKTLVLFGLLILLVLFIPKASFAADLTGGWAATTSLPYPIASHVSFDSPSKVSVIGGSAVTGQSKFDVRTADLNIDGTLSSWETQSASLPSALIFHSLAKKNNFVYVLGGREENPGSASDHVTSVFLGVINGSGTIPSWIPLNPLPKKSSLGKAVIVGDRIYYVGGFNSTETIDEVYYAAINLDGTLGSWNLAGLLPESLFGFGMVEYQNNLILVGGYNGSVYRNKTYKAGVNPDGTLSSWQETSSLPEPVYRSGVIRVDSTLISVGGHSGINFLDKIYYTNINSDGTLGPWQLSVNHLPRPVSAGAVAFSNNYLYLTGGFNGSYLNTVYFTIINSRSNLPVPYFSQNDLPWGPTEYDHAGSLGFSNITVDRWGCTITSVAMVLNFHQMTEFPDDAPINPGTLNEWLKNNHGFQTGRDRNGPYSKFVWSSIPRLTRELFEAEKAPYKLLHKRAGSGVDKDLVLQQDLTNQTPDILGVSNSQTNMHFVVAKGKTDSSYAINDPEWNYPDLTSFAGNTFSQLDRYLKSNTNLSYIEMSLNPSVEMIVIDPEGRKTGKQIINGVTQTFNEIPDAIYNFESPISNPNIDGQPENLGVGFNEFILPEPKNGEYKVVISNNDTNFYTLNITTVQEDGADDNVQLVGATGLQNTDQLNINYSQETSSEIEKVVTFKSAIADVNELRSINAINRSSISKKMIAILKNAKNNAQRGKKKKALQKLKRFEVLLNSSHPVVVNDIAYTILLYDVNYLKTHL